jgi:hypothetical protein
MLSDEQRAEIASRIFSEVSPAAAEMGFPCFPGLPAAHHFVDRWDAFSEDVWSLDPSRPDGLRELCVFVLALDSFKWLAAHFEEIERASRILSVKLSVVQTMRQFRAGKEELIDSVEASLSLSEWVSIWDDLNLADNYRDLSQSESEWLDGPMCVFSARINEITERPSSHRPKGRKKHLAIKLKERAEVIARLESEIEACIRSGRRFNKTVIATRLGMGGPETALQTLVNKLSALDINYDDVLQSVKDRMERKVKPEKS